MAPTYQNGSICRRSRRHAVKQAAATAKNAVAKSFAVTIPSCPHFLTAGFITAKA
jgi:hypothetical protein